MVQLASVTDVEAVLGRTLTTGETQRAGVYLDKASELFRRRSGQQFTAGESTVRLKVNGGKVHLPQRPVTAVTSVTSDDGKAVEYDWQGQWLTVPLISHQFVRVEYSHGGEVPTLVRLTVAEIAAKVLSVSDEAKQGVTQMSSTQGPFTDSFTYAGWAVGGQTILSPDDAATADTYKVPTPTVWVT